MMPNISFIVPTYNDRRAFETTLSSLRNNVFDGDEVVVVDSSDRSETIQVALREQIDVERARYFWVPPSGVYSAQNHGIASSTRPWVQVVNSGDRLVAGVRHELQKHLLEASASTYVFSQVSSINGQPVAEFHPTEHSVWPHQSTLVNRAVYESIGLYDERLKYVADQIFFAELKKKHSYKIIREIVSDYDLTGMSSNPNFELSRELFLLHRTLGRGIPASVFRGYLTPFGKRLMLGLFGRNKTERLLARALPWRAKLTDRTNHT